MEEVVYIFLFILCFILKGSQHSEYNLYNRTYTCQRISIIGASNCIIIKGL